MLFLGAGYLEDTATDKRRQKLDVLKKLLHRIPLMFGKVGRFGDLLVFVEHERVRQLGFGNRTVFQILHVGLGHVLVLGDKDKRFLPKGFFAVMVFYPFSEIFRFSDISLRLGCLIFSYQDVKSRLVQFLLLVQIGQVRARNDKHLANLVADKNILRSFRIAVDEVGSNCFSHNWSDSGCIKDTIFPFLMQSYPA